MNRQIEQNESQVERYQCDRELGISFEDFFRGRREAAATQSPPWLGYGVYQKARRNEHDQKRDYGRVEQIDPQENLNVEILIVATVGLAGIPLDSREKEPLGIEQKIQCEYERNNHSLELSQMWFQADQDDWEEELACDVGAEPSGDGAKVWQIADYFTHEWVDHVDFVRKGVAEEVLDDLEDTKYVDEGHKPPHVSVVELFEFVLAVNDYDKQITHDAYYD